jgi:hypothetical protein
VTYSNAEPTVIVETAVKVEPRDVCGGISIGVRTDLPAAVRQRQRVVINRERSIGVSKAGKRALTTVVTTHQTMKARFENVFHIYIPAVEFIHTPAEVLPHLMLLHMLML